MRSSYKLKSSKRREKEDIYNQSYQEQYQEHVSSNIKETTAMMQIQKEP
jgi:hypothetical protein